MKTKDILQITAVGLVGSVIAMYFVNKSQPKPRARRNPGKIIRDDVDWYALHQDYINNVRSTLEIAASIGVAKDTVLNNFKALGLETRSGSRQKMPIDWHALHQEYIHNGRSTAEIAASINMSQGSVIGNFKALGLELKSKKVIDVSEEELREWYEEYRSGSMSSKEIGEALGMSSRTLLSKFGELGLEPNKKGTRKKIEDIPEEELREWYEEYRSGSMSSDEIAAALEMDSKTLLNIFRELGLELHKSGRRAFALTEEELRRWYDERSSGNMSSQEIAEALGMKRKTLLAKFREIGLRIKPEGVDTDTIKEDLIEAHAEYIAGTRSSPEIAEEFGITQQVLLSKFRELGLDVKPRGSPVVVLEESYVRELYLEYAEKRSPAKEISARIGIDRSTLFNIFRKLDLEIRPERLNDSEVKAFYDEYMEDTNLTIQGIAERANVPMTYLRKRFKDLNLEVKKSPILTADISEDAWAKICSEYNGPNPPTIAELAKRNGVSPQTVSRYLKTKCGKQTPSYEEYSREIPALYKQGANLQGIYLHYDRMINIAKILLVLKNDGIQIRSTEPVVKYYKDGFSLENICELMNGTFTKEQILDILMAANS